MAELGIEVCYVLPDRQFLKVLRVQEGITLGQAIEQSGILNEAPEISLESVRVGIYGKLKTLETLLRDRDRVEIYRPLIADPMEARRRRAGKAGKTTNPTSPTNQTNPSRMNRGA